MDGKELINKYFTVPRDLYRDVVEFLYSTGIKWVPREPTEDIDILLKKDGAVNLYVVKFIARFQVAKLLYSRIGYIPSHSEGYTKIELSSFFYTIQDIPEIKIDSVLI